MGNLINTSNSTNPAIQVKGHANNVSANSRKSLDESFEKIADSFESQFIEQMLTEMQKTIPSNEEKSAAMEYYNSLMNSERAQAMMKQGIGIKELILQQIATHLVKDNVARNAVNKGEYYGN